MSKQLRAHNIGSKRKQLRIGLVASLALGTLSISGIAWADNAAATPEPLPEIVVHSSAYPHGLSGLAIPTQMLLGKDLTDRPQGNVGSLLSTEAGISSSSFGPGAGRPVVRGDSGERIRILQNGTSTQDVSSSSPDHPVTVDPSLLDLAEVIRGPASLMYGTNAIGGLVNLADGRIPATMPSGPVSGLVETRGNSADLERAGVARFEIPAGPFAIHLDAASRKTDDIYIPGFARTEEIRRGGGRLDHHGLVDHHEHGDEDLNHLEDDHPGEDSHYEHDHDDHDSDEGAINEPRKTLPFSATQTNSATAGASYILDGGYVGASVGTNQQVFGVPNGGEDISIDSKSDRYEMRGSVPTGDGLIESFSFNLAGTDYKHTEFEGDDVGTVFTNKGFEGRLELKHARLGDLKGVWGYQLQDSDFEAIGAEAFQPPTDATTNSGFIYEEYELSKTLALQASSRLDFASLSTSGLADGRVADNEIDNTNGSQSFGLLWRPNSSYSGLISFAHTERSASGQELFANGPHVATAAYEIGDPDLKTERANGIDISIRKHDGFFRGSLGAFYNQVDNYISLNRGINLDAKHSEEHLDDLPIYLFQNNDATFLGFEMKGAVHFIDNSGENLSIDIQPDYVHAQNRDLDTPLPRITPFRIRSGINYYRENLFRIRLEAQNVLRQERTAFMESETPGYTMLNLMISKEIPIKSSVAELFLRGTNLLNETAREHTSFIKDIAPLPGASVSAGVRFRF